MYMTLKGWIIGIIYCAIAGILIATHSWMWALPAIGFLPAVLDDHWGYK